MDTKKTRVLILTGFSSLGLSQLNERAISSEVLPLLFSMLGKDTFHFTVPPMGPVAVGSYLKHHNIEVKIDDFYYDGVHSSDFDIVGISSTFMVIEDIEKITGLVRQQNPDATIVLGGHLSWIMPPAVILEKVPNIDYIVLKEGEEALLKLIGALSGNSDPQLVQGIVYRDRKKGVIVETPPQMPVDIEALPLPAWELMGVPSSQRLPVLPLETSRGCPYNCAYCAEVTYWSRPVRYRSNDRVVNEIISNVEKYGISTFRFTDSCFSAPPERCTQVCDAIYEKCINNGIPVKWSVYSRIENLSPSLLDRMRRAGCVALDVGLESGSPEVLRRMGKNFDPEIAVTIAKAARESGIIIHYNLIVGFPGETRETLQATTEIVERAAPDTFTCYVLLLKPNTRVYDQRDKFGIEGSGLSWKHATMSSEEAREAQRKLVREITSSTDFAGGEHFTCYLTSLGYSQEEIRGLYRAVSRITRNPEDEATRSMLEAAVRKMANYA
jgi:anaerobic magnesium-protoporphyrin IX monomethyl ester cyclase